MSRLLRLSLPIRLFFLLCLFGSLAAQDTPEHVEWVRSHYSKFEYQVPMRDQVTLFTSVYVPNWSQDKFPIVMMRTPYSVGPYGTDKYRTQLGPSADFDKEGFIFVFQDVRGRYMSGGSFDNMRPEGTYPGAVNKKAPVNESTDAYDTIDWLIKNLANAEPKVGQWGVSYPGFYTATSMIDSHPALKIASPQAPIADWFWDDMHHNGAFSLNLAFNFFSSFGVARPEPTPISADHFKHGTPDGYQFFLDMGPLSQANKKYFHGEIVFWNDIVAHPNYDDFWQARNLLPHLKNVNCAVLVVGGLFDSEDLYGPLSIHKAVRANNPNVKSTLVMGPWSHGGWIRTKGDKLGDAQFGFGTTAPFLKQVLLPAFLHRLKGGPDPALPAAMIFETGANRWRTFDAWPPAAAKQKSLYLNPNSNASFEAKTGAENASFISDPAHPVPSTTAISTQWGRDFMAEDQRFAGRRPDVLSFSTDVLSEDLTLAGPIDAELWVSTDQTDADWVVKIIDVYPSDEPSIEVDGKTVERGNAQVLVRYEIIRGRFRESFETPKPFEANKVTKVPLRLMDVLHNFQKGHRLMVQVQSSFFPFFDRNPQKFVPNIFEATEADFVSATHRIWFTPEHHSLLKVGVLAQ